MEANIPRWSKNILMEQTYHGGAKYFNGGKHTTVEQKYTKYNKINNKSENFRGQDCC